MNKLFALFAVLSLTACGSIETDANQSYPKDPDDVRRLKNGTLSGNESGYNLFGGPAKDDDSKGSGIGVNSFLWRASLDTLSFMPIVQADAFGGVILTDWYEDPENKGERFKANVTILDNRLRADGVRVALFKQKYDDKAGWRDETVSRESQREIENTILTRARELRVKQTGK